MDRVPLRLVGGVQVYFDHVDAVGQIKQLLRFIKRDQHFLVARQSPRWQQANDLELDRALGSRKSHFVVQLEAQAFGQAGCNDRLGGIRRAQEASFLHRIRMQHLRRAWIDARQG